MPAKSTSKSKRPAPAKAKRPAQRSKVVTSKKQSKLSRLFSSKVGILVVAILIGTVGTYLLAYSHADQPLPDNNPARGLYYSAVGEKKVKNGPCKDDLQDITEGQSTSVVSCTHPDPGPDGVDVRERAKQVEGQMAAEADYDSKHPNQGNGKGNSTTPPAGSTTANDVSYAGSLSDVAGNVIPCIDPSQGGYIRLLYAYQSGTSNRLSALRSGFEAIARRTNAVMYNTSVASGSPRELKVLKNSACSELSITAVPVTVGDMSNYGYIVNKLRAAGYHSTQVKYLVWIDSNSGCGQGSVYDDNQPGQANANNQGNSFALVWRPCWNYAEPHELMHTLGSVIPGAPYSTTGYHCYDQHDVMCYNDGTHTMSQVCTGSVYIWRYDCHYNTYFNSGTPTGYLASHWNTANSRFLVHY